MTWYRKKTDPGALYCARMIGDAGLYGSLGSYIHGDDMPGVLKALGLRIVPPELFEPCLSPYVDYAAIERDTLRSMPRDQVPPELIRQWEALQ